MASFILKLLGWAVKAHEWIISGAAISAWVAAIKAKSSFALGVATGCSIIALLNLILKALRDALENRAEIGILKRALSLLNGVEIGTDYSQVLHYYVLLSRRHFEACLNNWNPATAESCIGEILRLFPLLPKDRIKTANGLEELDQLLQQAKNLKT